MIENIIKITRILKDQQISQVQKGTETNFIDILKQLMTKMFHFFTTFKFENAWGPYRWYFG